MKPTLHFCLTMGLTLIVSISSNGQTAPFSTIEYIDINNIKAAHLVHGDMWWNPGTSNPASEFPKGSGKHIASSAAIWMGAYESGVLKVSAQTYRQNGNDYWPGPLNSATPISYIESQNWAKIWKVNASDLDNFLKTSPHTLTNTPTVILEWPAKGNPYAKGNGGFSLTIANDLAPFVDVNNDGVYDPLSGDYPAMKGDQMLWNVFNDNGPTHNETNGIPLGVEVRCLVYAYKRNTSVDNTIFYEYQVKNNSSSSLDSFVLGIRADMDLGYYLDDYIGFDSLRNLGVIYNATVMDGTGQTWQYGDTIPTAGIRVVQWNRLDTCGINTLAGSFMYYNNNGDSTRGNPTKDTQYNNYLRHRWRNGQPLTNDFQGVGIPSNGTGAGPAVNYVFSGNPANNTEWSECVSNNMAGDRRFVIAGSPTTIMPGTVEKFSFALMATPRKYQNGCPNVNFNDIQLMSDTAKSIYCNPLTPVYNSIKDVGMGKKQLKIYPNPANQNIYVQVPFNQNEQIQVYDGLGRNVHVVSSRMGNQIELNIEKLSDGVYYIIYRSEDKAMSNSFIKK